MAHYQFWDGVSDICTPSGDMFTAQQWRDRHAWVKVPGAKMIVSAGVINGGVAMEFTATKDLYKKLGANITDAMTDEEVLSAIEEYEDNPPAGEPTTEERTAAALEFLAMNSLPDETETTKEV